MFLFIDNYDSFTYNIVQIFQGLGRNPLVLTNDDPRILDMAADPSLECVCISPGPGNPKTAGFCLEFLARLPKHVPVLGVCLGHQCLGEFAGASVVKAPFVMHGKCSEITHDGTGLFSGIENPMKVGRYHSLVVESKDDFSNPMFSVTARAPEGEVMALRYKDRPWVGIQFHPESILTPEGRKLLANFPQAIQPEGSAAASVPAVLEALAQGRDLSAEMAAHAFAALMDGRMSDAQAGSFLMGLRMKGESSLEIAHAVNTALARSLRVDGITGACIDIVGTGGDGKHSFNCSTAASLVMAGLGYRVVKHGNRAVSSSCGSADALESLGVPLDVSPDEAARMVERSGFAFLFAPKFHPSFRNIGPIRKELGMRTLFNLIGPLLNPARPSHLLMGVAKPELVDLISDAIRQSHIEKAIVVCGAGGYDELTQLGKATLKLIDHGRVVSMELDPAEFGFKPCEEAALAVESREEAVKVLKRILAGEGPAAMMDMLALNVGLAMFLMEAHAELRSCMARAREAVYAGVGRRVLEGIEG